METTAMLNEDTTLTARISDHEDWAVLRLVVSENGTTSGTVSLFSHTRAQREMFIRIAEMVNELAEFEKSELANA
jgi:hypothetical protein